MLLFPKHNTDRISWTTGGNSLLNSYRRTVDRIVISNTVSVLFCPNYARSMKLIWKLSLAKKFILMNTGNFSFCSFQGMCFLPPSRLTSILSPITTWYIHAFLWTDKTIFDHKTMMELVKTELLWKCDEINN